MSTTSFISPKQSFDFTTAALDGSITFARTTGASNPATYVNSGGVVTVATNDQPRFDHNPVTLACKGLLIEESRTNLFLQSQDLATTWVALTGTVNANQVISPDGAQNADEVVAPNGSDATVAQTVPTTTTSYCWSVFAKSNGLTTLRFYSRFNPQNDIAVFNLATLSATGTSARIEDYGDGWYRCSAVFTPTSSSATNNYRFRTEVGDGIKSMYLWGAQLEAGTFATSYIPTTTTALTRNADLATITGTNFSDFWQATKGGASVLATPSTVSGIRPLVQFDDNTADNIIALRGNTANPELQIVDGGTPQAQLDAGTIAANTPYSLTGWWQTNDCKARKDSGAVVTDTTATIPTVTQMRIGSDGTNYLNGTIATINYYDSFFGRPIYTRRKNKVFPSLL
jgi:hypothetical protein